MKSFHQKSPTAKTLSDGSWAWWLARWPTGWERASIVARLGRRDKSKAHISLFSLFYFISCLFYILCSLLLSDLFADCAAPTVVVAVADNIRSMFVLLFQLSSLLSQLWLYACHCDYSGIVAAVVAVVAVDVAHSKISLQLCGDMKNTFVIRCQDVCGANGQ